jgi:hypothetical protein
MKLGLCMFCRGSGHVAEDCKKKKDHGVAGVPYEICLTSICVQAQ